MIYYIAPNSSGKGDGSSWANAASLSSLSSLVEKASGGDTIYLRADAGSYTVNRSINLNHGGSDGAPITIKGVDVNGNAMDATFVGSRAAVYSPTAAQGSEVFRINNGADNLTLENMTFKAVSTAIRVTGDVENLHISNMTANNVDRFFENYATSGQKTATISGLTITDVDVTGFAKGVIRLQYDTHDVLIDKVSGDSQFIDGANFAIGVALGGTVHDVLIRNTQMGNIRDTTNAYYNGDGFSAEADVYNLRIENSRAFNNTDSGFDIKSQSTVLVNVEAEGNTRNYRFWSDVVVENAISKNPVYHGGIGTSANIWMLGSNDVKLTNVTIDDSASTNWLFHADRTGGSLTLDNVVTMNSNLLTRVKLEDIMVLGKAQVYVEPSKQAVDSEVSALLTQFGISTADRRLMSGNSGDNDLQAGSDTRYVFSGQGNDRLVDSSSVKMLAGGSGDDIYVVGQQGTIVHELANGGTDTVETSLSSYRMAANIERLVYTGTESFTAHGNELANTIIGGDKADRLTGGGGSDVIRGGKGDDIVRGGDGNDQLDGGPGNDTLDGDEGNDSISSGAGDDTARGGAGNDKITGDSGNDAVVGDVVDLTAKFGPAGKDHLEGNDGNDTLYGDALTISGGVASDDNLFGGAGDDILFGDAIRATRGSVMGNDFLYGGDGNDRLYGDLKEVTAGVAGGTNWLEGGNGNDRLYGGSGKDTFAFNADEQGDDLVYGFTQTGSARDVIALSGFNSSFADLEISYSRGNAVIDLGGNQTVTVMGTTSLTADDFVFI